MRNYKKDWFVTIVISLCSILLALFIGFAVSKISSPKKTSSTEADTVATVETDEEETRAYMSTIAPTEKETVKQTEAESTKAEETEAKTEEETETQGPVSLFKEITPERLEEIALSFDRTNIYYSIDGDRNDKNRPVNAVNLFNSLNETFTDFRVFNSAAPDSKEVSLIFILDTSEKDKTKEVLAVLKEKDVKAVFFSDLIYSSGNFINIYRLLKDGHELGSLGASDPAEGLGVYGLQDQYADIKRYHDYILDKLNYNISKFYYNHEVFNLADIAMIEEMGYTACMFSASYNDNDTSSPIEPEAMLEELKAQLHDGAVYKLHTANDAILTVLPEFIDYLKSEGYAITGIK